MGEINTVGFQRNIRRILTPNLFLAYTMRTTLHTLLLLVVHHTNNIMFSFLSGSFPFFHLISEL